MHLSYRMQIRKGGTVEGALASCLSPLASFYYLYLKSFPYRLLAKSGFNLRTRKIPDPMSVQQLAVCM